MREYASQAVVWQTAINPVVALELLDRAPGRARACSAPRRSRRSSAPVAELPLAPFLEQLGDGLASRPAASSVTASIDALGGPHERPAAPRELGAGR